MAETAAGRVDWMTGVEQALPFPGKLREMARAAGKDAEAAAAMLESVQLEIAAGVRRAYWNQYLAVQTTAITQGSRDALVQIRDSVDARAAANQADQGDQLRLSTEIGKVEAALVRSHQGEASARSRLNSLLNRAPSAPLPAPKLDQRKFDRDLQSLLAKAESQHPEVKAARAELEAFQHRLKRAELDRYPDFAFGLQHASVADSGLAPSANGRDQVFATLGITLPIWQEPRKARIGEAAAGIEESSARIDATRAGLRYRVEDAWLRAKSTEELITLFEKQIIPEAQQAFDGVLTSYSTGKQSFVDALDVWRQLLAFRLQQATNQSMLGMAVADLRSATGEQP
jgi:outer membrane protein TolC